MSQARSCISPFTQVAKVVKLKPGLINIMQRSPVSLKVVSHLQLEGYESTMCSRQWRCSNAGKRNFAQPCRVAYKASHSAHKDSGKNRCSTTRRVIHMQTVRGGGIIILADASIVREKFLDLLYQHLAKMSIHKFHDWLWGVCRKGTCANNGVRATR